MDAFAVAAAVSAVLPELTKRHSFRLIWHFGLFQALMTVFGWLGGESFASYTGGLNVWIASGLLALLGLNMLRQSLHQEERAEGFDPTRGWSLMALSVATSIDALAVGITFSLINVDIVSPALIIGFTALIMTYIGTRIGVKAGNYLGKWGERVGGVILIILGLRIAFMT